MTMDKAGGTRDCRSCLMKAERSQWVPLTRDQCCSRSPVTSSELHFLICDTGRSSKSLGPHPRVGHLPSFREAARRPGMRRRGHLVLGSLPQASRPGPGGGRTKAHQLMLLLQLGLPVLASGPPASARHQGLALLTQSLLLVFDQLQPGVEMRLLPYEARRPSLPSPRSSAHQILSLASPPGLREDPGSWGAHAGTRVTAAPASDPPLGPGWCQQHSDSDGALATRP